MKNDSTSEVVDVVEVADVADVSDARTADAAGITDELLIEEISIDGMCGVY